MLNASKGPDFSFIVPAYNEEAVISKCLASLRQTITPGTPAEIIVVDNGSTDNTRANAERLESITVYRCPGAKVGAVRNLGARKARGQYLVFIDADCLVDPDFLARAKDLVKTDPERVWGGGATNPENATWVERHWLLETDGKALLPKHLIGASILAPRFLFEKVGGFDENLESGEDTNLHHRFLMAGITVSMTDALNVAHLGNAKTISAFFHRQAWHGRSYHPNPLKNLHDPVYILTLLSGLGALVGLLLLPAMPREGALLLAFSAMAPAILTAKRFLRAKRWPRSLREAIRCYVLDGMYVMGRLKGAIDSSLNPQSRTTQNSEPR